MSSSLKPELRGARRVLRSANLSETVHTRQTTRSFARFARLQAPNESTPSPDKPSDGSNPFPRASVLQFNDLPGPVQNFFRTLGGRDAVLPPPSIHGQDYHIDGHILGDTSLRGTNLTKEAQYVQKFVDQGKIAPGCDLIFNDATLSPDVRNTLNQHNYRPPYLYAKAGLPALTQQTYLVRLEPETAEKLRANDQDDGAGTTSVATNEKAELGAETAHYGSAAARRKRARPSVSFTSSAPPSLPVWFMENNIVLADRPKVQGVTHGYDTSAASSSEGAATQIQLERKVESVDSPQPESKEHAHGAGDDSSPSTDGSSGPAKTSPRKDNFECVQLSDKRYYLDHAQYQEVFTTFKGRLQAPTYAANSRSQNTALAINHLTLNHTAKDADLLLDTLIKDMATAVGADLVRLDAQDISAIIARADVDPIVAQKGGRLSFRVYREIYGSDNRYQEAFNVPSNEEEDADNEDEDREGPQGIEIPVGVMMGPFSGRRFQQHLNDVTRRFQSNGGGILGQLMNAGPTGPENGMFTSTIESILSSPLQKSTSADPNDSSDSTSTYKPIVIHVPNYRAIQGHRLAESFLAELIALTNRRIANGQRILIAGTDCMRDFNVQNTSYGILEEQEAKSYGSSTNIAITSVFPDRDAELALLKDREQKIRIINVRHLWNVVQSRGVLLRGLEAGFWTRDFRAEIGEDDWKVLGEQFWPFMQIQRIAALIAGRQSQSPITEAVRTLEASDNSKLAWARRNTPDLAKEEQKEAEKPETKKLSKIRAKATRHEKKLMSGVIEPKKITTTFKDIHIPAETVEALQMLTTLSLVRPEAFRYGVLKSDRIPGLLLYGPPGTGKTLAAKAVAKESGATMLEVSAADLNNMYVGEGEKNVQALFSLAKKLSPCVVFLDEADAMFSARSAQGRRVSHRELLNQFLKEWDGMSNDSGSAFIMVATNRPMDLDDAVLRRLPRRLLVDLPTEADRLEILKIHLRHEQLADDVSLPDLAKKTPFYSGSDLKNVAVAAALNAVRDENEAAKKHNASNADSDDAQPYQYPERRTLTKQHFERALEEISASISEDMSSLKEIKKFDEQYGDRKGRKKKSPKWGFRSAGEADRVLETVKVRS